MYIKQVFFVSLTGGLLALGFAVFRILWIVRQPVTIERLRKIGTIVANGAMTFLYREYRVLLPFVVVVAALLGIANKGHLRFQAVSFILGALCSTLAGYIGMRVATLSNTRTTEAASKMGLNAALKVAFSGGSVIGLSVVGLALTGLSIVCLAFTGSFGADIITLREVVLPIVTGFAFGASAIALFARVGGGIFTKAADVGADLVGKVEAGIPEDDPRNPATIADNVGDNVGDVAGMGADLFESFVGCIVGSMILGLSMEGTETVRLKLIVLPLLLVTLGIVSSIIGMRFVRTKPEGSPQKALNKGTFVAAVLAAILSYIVVRLFLGSDTFNDGAGANQVFLSSLLGLATGVAIGMLTEFFTGTGKHPVTSIKNACETGPATALITGMSVGMMSTFPILVLIGVAIFGSHALAGLYGVAIASVGMLITLGIQLAVDAYGPIADNAGGLAEMTELPPEVRNITDTLDAVGNTTAAIGKGFAIGSAALTSIILFTSFKESVAIGVIDLTRIPVLVGILIGAVVPYLFSSLLLGAVGKAAYKMIEEVRNQFQQRPEILSGDAEPDYNRCIDISTTAALKQMLLPGAVAILTPVLVGFLVGVEMLLGLLVGVTSSGVVLAIFMSNSGGAWDNAKKMIESGGSKGSNAHKAAVVGDTVGDPFKDTAGPSLNILIKLMSMVSLVIAPLLQVRWG
ncbi:MAG TPA: sodium-translocating pyrophosphatase [bacterium]|nr:sodium-translocating pyrophosphatase [bacterium]